MWVVSSAVMVTYLQAVCALIMVVVVVVMTVVVVMVVVMIFIISKVVVHGTAGYVGVQEVVRSAVMIPYLQAVSALIMMMVFIMMMMVVVTIRRQRVIMARSGNRRLPRLQDRL